jgi:hypothetical protein
MWVAWPQPSINCVVQCATIHDCEDFGYETIIITAQLNRILKQFIFAGLIE